MFDKTYYWIFGAEIIEFVMFEGELLKYNKVNEIIFNEASLI